MVPTKPVTQQDIDHLNALLSKAKELHNWKKKRRYYHFVTVENFIYHLPKFKDRRTKLYAFHQLQDYLRILTEIDALEDLDVFRSRELYLKYIDPLVHEFVLRLGFVPRTTLRTHIILLLAAETIAFSLQATIWIKVVLAVAFFLHSLRQSAKQQQKKVYGLFV